MSAAPRGSRAWLAYFEQRLLVPCRVPWERGARLTPAEREAIAESIATFQRGESSEGRGLYARAVRHATLYEDPDYVEAVALFIGEEQRHARDLGRYMGLAGIPRRGRAASDAVFRALRRRFGLEGEIAVLLTAEMLAESYYAALRDATGCPVLRALCERILEDERAHVAFQAERLEILRRGRSRARNALALAAQRALYLGAALVVAVGHRAVLRRGGRRAARFARDAAEAWRRAGLEAPSSLKPAGRTRSRSVCR